MSTPTSDAQTGASLDGASFLSNILSSVTQFAVAKAGVKPAQNISGTSVSNAAPASTTAAPASSGFVLDQKTMLTGALVIGAVVVAVVLFRKS